MKSAISKVVALVLCCVCLVSCVCVAYAGTYESVVKFTEGRAVYGPSTSGYYHRKNNSNTNWSVSYDSGWNATTSAYLYDKQYGDRATHIKSLIREDAPSTGLLYLNSSCCKSSHDYKIVAKRDISQYSGPYDFVYTWTI